MGSLYKRGHVWWVKYYRNGKAFRESSKSRTLRDARRLLQRREAEIGTGNFTRLEAERVRFEEIADDFLNEYQANQLHYVVSE